MAIEVYKGAAVAGNAGTQPAYHLYYFAKGFSGFTNYDIIDSYSSVTGRYTGDPIANSIWTGTSSIGAANSWFVVRASSSATPKWEAKFQSINNGQSFDDPSGIDYGHEGEAYNVMVRISPIGGWNTTSLDFNTPAAASQNRVICCHSGTSSPSAFNYIVADEEAVVLINRYWSASSNWWNFRSVNYLGSVYPKSDDALPRILICDDTTTAGGAAIAPGGTTGFLYVYAGGGRDGLGLRDSGGTWRQGTYAVDDYSTFLNVGSQPSAFDGYLDVLSILPVFYGTFTNIIGELRLLGICNGPGPGALFNDETWLGLADGYGVCIEWDGSTNPQGSGS